ncbi:membrane protein [Gordonia phage Tardus]|uniref:Uncharacterized protein n=5 Tax=Zitchvirus TaxID=2948963 RepID=A0A976YDF6_9CAUD|nr:hypothetical protein J1774_gp28 [Gordonia Phage Zitch]URC17644.1 membrane protein [Gordonia phage Tardus]UTN91767.1 hypothetical protein SEA_SAMPSON_27 [Gordonia Phage Sampson]UVF61649.1 hypothetical protein SEA_APUNK_28 [Gordonia phage APunk]UVG34990.1 hypothetical protein SEA_VIACONLECTUS_27 [Gordonia phage ViaConlectus]QKY78475.1 hypothetical protein SEA_ZITCH_28 [Gordonia Phage Zitch]
MTVQASAWWVAVAAALIAYVILIAFLELLGVI